MSRNDGSQAEANELTVMTSCLCGQESVAKRSTATCQNEIGRRFVMLPSPSFLSVSLSHAVLCLKSQRSQRHFPCRFLEIFFIRSSEILMMKNEKQLWEACTEGNPSLVKELCRDRAINVHRGDPEAHRTALYRACGHGKVAVVKELLTHPKIDPNIPRRTMPLHCTLPVKMGMQKWSRCCWVTTGWR